ncbi:MAG: GIY-YIG nuclease family protein [Pseudomonadales bacterium]
MQESESERRKRLSAEYKKQPREMGLYAIRNTVSGKLFVGTSVDLRARFNRHRMNLKFGTEDHPALQQDWNALGSEAFVFEVLEHLEPLEEAGYDAREDLKELKILWLERQAAQGNAYYE